MIKPEDIIRAEFSRSFLGYDMKEVDTLLDAVAEQMEAWEKERAEMLTALEYLLQEIEQKEKEETASAKRIAEQGKTAHITQGKTAEETERMEQREQRRRMRELLASSPLPQAVTTDPAAAEQTERIPLAKAYAETEEAASFEIPTYVFAGASEQEAPAAPTEENPNGSTAAETQSTGQEA